MTSRILGLLLMLAAMLGACHDEPHVHCEEHCYYNSYGYWECETYCYEVDHYTSHSYSSELHGFDEDSSALPTGETFAAGFDFVGVVRNLQPFELRLGNFQTTHECSMLLSLAAFDADGNLIWQEASAFETPPSEPLVFDAPPLDAQIELLVVFFGEDFAFSVSNEFWAELVDA